MSDEFKIALACIAVLEGRKGFDHFWGDLDASIKQEICEDIADKIKGILEPKDS